MPSPPLSAAGGRGDGLPMSEEPLTGAAEAAPQKRRKWMRVQVIVILPLVLVLLAIHPRGRQTYLIIGMDNYGSLAETGRSDVMMLVHIDFNATKVYAVTFARDMLVENADGRDVKINTIVRNQDENALAEAIERNFGVPIDGWFRLNFTTLVELVDALGGAQVELTAEEAHYIDRTAGLYPGYPLAEGPSRLNGAQALCYARCRTLDSDLGRGQRQSKLVSALVAQTKSLNVNQLVDVYNSLNHAWVSSLSGGEQAALLTRALWLRGAQVERVGVPFDGTYHYGSDANVVANLENNRDMLRAVLNIGPAVPAVELE